VLGNITIFFIIVRNYIIVF